MMVEIGLFNQNRGSFKSVDFEMKHLIHMMKEKLFIDYISMVVSCIPKER